MDKKNIFNNDLLLHVLLKQLVNVLIKNLLLN